MYIRCLTLREVGLQVQIGLVLVVLVVLVLPFLLFLCLFLLFLHLFLRAAAGGLLPSMLPLHLHI